MVEKFRTALLLVLSLMLLLTGCQPAKREVKRIAGKVVPQVRATVITIRTTLQPTNKTATHTIVIGPDFARSTAETGIYRLFDLKKNRVLFVNEFDKSFRAEPLDSIVARRKAAAAGSPPSDQPRAGFASTGATRTIAGVAAAQSLVKLGAYQREIWVGMHPLIPPQLFAMEYATAPGTKADPVEKDVEAALMALRGFPLLDHAELPYGTTKMVVDRQVLSVEQKNVPESLVVLPAGYEDKTPRPKAPPARRPPASSRPAGQKTPAAE